MYGWIACSWNDPDLRFVHLRPMGSSQQSIYTGRMRHGYGQYFMGTGFLYLAASALSRVNQEPYVLGSFSDNVGLGLRAPRYAKPKYDNVKFRQFLRRYQMRALLSESSVRSPSSLRNRPQVQRATRAIGDS